MQTINVTIVLMLLPLSIYAQNRTAQSSAQRPGIQFETGMSWEQVVKIAKATNKHIFVDCYATWCSPCRYMADSIFTRQEVGDFMNQHFVNITRQMDKTDKDPAAVRACYEDANRIMEQYHVTALPTFLFFTPDGECIYKAVGVYNNVASFVAKATQALDPDEQYFFLLEQYYKGRNEPAFIARLLDAAKKSGDKEIVDKLSKEKEHAIKRVPSPNN